MNYRGYRAGVFLYLLISGADMDKIVLVMEGALEVYIVMLLLFGGSSKSKS